LETLQTHYVAFADPGNNINFNEAIDSITRKILEQGKAEVVRNLIARLGFPDRLPML